MTVENAKGFALMSWSKIMVPLSGLASDVALLTAAAELAAPFGAEVAAVFAPPDVADLVPWMSDGMGGGGAEIAAIEALRGAAAEGEGFARGHFEALAAPRKTFLSVTSPVITALALESRLSDVVLFDGDAACGRSRLGQVFQAIGVTEQRPVLVSKRPLGALATVVVAWNGGREASRAARTALPILQKAARVVVITAAETRTKDLDPQRLAAFLAVRGVKAEARRLESGDAAGQIQAEANSLGADLIVSGAFGHARLREYVFGGVTKSLLNAAGPSLFLSH